MSHALKAQSLTHIVTDFIFIEFYSTVFWSCVILTKKLLCNCVCAHCTYWTINIILLQNTTMKTLNRIVLHHSGRGSQVSSSRSPSSNCSQTAHFLSSLCFVARNMKRLWFYVYIFCSRWPVKFIATKWFRPWVRFKKTSQEGWRTWCRPLLSAVNILDNTEGLYMRSRPFKATRWRFPRCKHWSITPTCRFETGSVCFEITIRCPRFGASIKPLTA